MLRLFPLSTVAIAIAAFGICGLALDAAGTTSGVTLAGALGAAVVAGALNSAAFAYLRRSESSASVRDEQLVGSVGRVVLPVLGDRRGRIAVSAGDQQLYLSARALPNDPGADTEFEVGAPVLVIEVRDGVAAITRLDPELA
jgi:membrane protein implicated in regulation of membrane protease activity